MKSEKFSKTAAYVAIKFYGLSQIEQYGKLFDEEVNTFYDRLIAALPEPLNRYHTLLTKIWFRSTCMCLEEAMLPGDLLHILMRKYYISSTVDRLIHAGFNQILILGAGFDHIGSIYSRKGISCIELDTAPVMNIKQHFLETNNYVNEKLSIHPVNINRTPLSALLSDIAAIDPDAKTITIAEGFYDYLTPGKFSETLRCLNRYFNNDMKLISTVFSLEQLSPFHAFVFKNAVKAVGERLQLHAELKEFLIYLKKNNFQINHIWDSSEMRNGIPVLQDSKMAVLSGFYLLEASKNS